ncbi:long-chain-fatty-acid--CoA ligase [Roseovarius sp. A-2]|uniref:malonate--CoA ligase n=1 Tax=Roseovarius sp. A-2 TaxID=1570360 RepID=UPI0009B524C2|nr:malonyl-CoA synthase [Roseovarius sp. A-2]GAW35448.1 long-chain-fatty-acid--CoA ligase [Roseovarius sp. A-2]
MNPLYDRFFAPHRDNKSVFLKLADGTALTYAEFRDRVGQIANTLLAWGLHPGDRVAVQIEKSPDALALYGACAQTGTVFLPLNTGYTADELSYFVKDSGAKLFICDPANAEALDPVARRHRAKLETLGVDGAGSLSRAANSQSPIAPTAEVQGNDLAALLYTSGTTGRSKGAMLTHDNLVSNAETLAEYWRFTSDDVLLHALPIFHTHGLFVAINVTLAAGSSMIFMPKFDIDVLLAEMPGASVLMGVPTFYTRLLDDVRLNKDVSAEMRLFISGSAPLLAETHIAFQQRTGHRILERYGMTETNMNASNPYDGDRRAGTVGRPLPGIAIKIMDTDTDTELPQGEIGQIVVRGPNVFCGYWNMPEKTAEELWPDGFFITGDLGQFDEDGYLQIVGRQKDLIISGGYNIYPKEIELLLDENPNVVESAVVGVPHADFGEAVVAYVVPTADSPPDPALLQELCRRKLARFKHPQDILLITDLPRNTMGKVQKNVLRDRYIHAKQSSVEA